MKNDNSLIVGIATIVLTLIFFIVLAIAGLTFYFADFVQHGEQNTALMMALLLINLGSPIFILIGYVKSQTSTAQIGDLSFGCLRLCLLVIGYLVVLFLPMTERSMWGFVVVYLILFFFIVLLNGFIRTQIIDKM